MIVFFLPILIKYSNNIMNNKIEYTLSAIMVDLSEKNEGDKKRQSSV